MTHFLDEDRDGQPDVAPEAPRRVHPVDEAAEWGEEGSTPIPPPEAIDADPPEPEVIDQIPSEQPAGELPANVPTDEAVPIPKDAGLVIDLVSWLTPERRRLIYGVLAAVGALATGFNWVTAAQAESALNAANAVLGAAAALGGFLAYFHTPKKKVSTVDPTTENPTGLPANPAG